MFAAAKGFASSAASKMPVSSIASKLPNTGAVKGLLNKGAGTAINKYVPEQFKGLAKNAASVASQQAVNKGSNDALQAATKNVPGGAEAVKMAKSLGFKSSEILDSMKSAPEKIQTFFAGLSDNTKMILGGVVVIIALIIALVVYFNSQKSTSNFANVQQAAEIQRVKAEENAAALAPKSSGLATLQKKEGFQNQEKGTDISLLNIQPFTVKQAGFLGPVQAGVFEEGTAIEQALRAGVRTFVFQIDYHEDSTKGPPSFPEAGEPSLLYRDDSGKLVSLNAGSILRVSKFLAELAFSDKIVSKTDPVVILLHGLRAPDPIEKPKEYIRYCSAIAKQLKPLAPFHLGLTSEGDYHRQALQGQLFTTPFQKFEKKIIILSTFDTSMFRNVKKLGLSTIDPVEDLDYWVNAQIFTEKPTKVSGVAAVAPANTKVRASIVSLSEILNLSEADKKVWATRNKDIFTIAMPSQNTNPNEEGFMTALTNLGINVVPLDIFSFEAAQTQRLTEILERKTWKMRPLALRVASK